MEELVGLAWFERIIIGLILLNTLSLASEHYEEETAVTETNVVANLFFTIIFVTVVFELKMKTKKL